MEAMSLAARLATYYGEKTAARRLRQHPYTLRRITDEGHVPYIQHGRVRLFERCYIDGLADLLERSYLGHVPHLDRTLITLYFLRWQYNQCADGQSSERHGQLAEVKRQCAGLVQNDRAVTLIQLCAALREYASPQTVRRWARLGRLAAVKVGTTTYTSRRALERLGWYFDECEPFAIVAARRGIGRPDLINSWVRKKRVRAIVGPDGSPRLMPNTVLPMVQEDGVVTLAVASHRLGVTPDCVIKNVDRGYLESVGFGISRRIPEKVVTYWEERFNQLNLGFGWLQELADERNQPLAVITPKQVARILGFADTTFLNAWCPRDLLPYYVRSFGGGVEIRRFPRLYVEGLRRFAGDTLPVPRSQAAAYRALCAERGNIA